MTTLVEGTHPGGFLVWEAFRDYRHEAPLQGASEMSREDAYRVLGLEPGSTEDEIREAYRRLIKRLHPDSGGSAVLMGQITAARDRLLGEW